MLGRGGLSGLDLQSGWHSGPALRAVSGNPTRDHRAVEGSLFYSNYCGARTLGDALFGFQTASVMGEGHCGGHLG